MRRGVGSSVYRGLKTASRTLLSACGPLKVAAGLSRIRSISTLARFGSVSEEDADRFMPVDVALDLMAASGDLTLLEVMAFHLDCEIRPLADAPSDAALAAGQQIGVMGSLISDLAAVLEDGEITRDEIEERGLVAELEQVITQARKLRAGLQRQIRAGEPVAPTSGGAE